MGDEPAPRAGGRDGGAVTMVAAGGAQARDPWYARVVFRALDGWGTWMRCVLGAVLMIAAVGLVAGGILVVVTRLEPTVAGLSAGGLAALGTATAVWRRRRR